MRSIRSVSAREIPLINSPGSDLKWIDRCRQIRSSAGHSPHHTSAWASLVHAARACTARTSAA